MSGSTRPDEKREMSCTDSSFLREILGVQQLTTDRSAVVDKIFNGLITNKVFFDDSIEIGLGYVVVPYAIGLNTHHRA